MLKRISFQNPLIVLIIVSLANICFAQTAFQQFFGPSLEKYNKIKVERVLGTDMIQLENGTKVKLIGLKSPFQVLYKQIKRDENGMVIEEEPSPETPLEETAVKFVKEMLLNKYVRLEFDIQNKDPDNFSYALAYVFTLDNDTFVNAEILRQGFANLHIQPPNTKYADQLREAYREAKKEKRGLQGE